MSIFVITLSIITVLALSLLVMFWSHKAYIRFVVMLLILAPYYIDLFKLYYLAGWSYPVSRNIDLIITNIVYLIILFVGGGLLVVKLDRPNKGEVLSGTEVTSAAKANKINQKLNKAESVEYPIKIGSVCIAHAVENQHFAICGTTGSGKTQAINSMLLTIRTRNKKAIIADAGGEFISHFYKGGDLILNPFDRRSAFWSPFAEIRQDYDCSMIARLTIPEGKVILRNGISTPRLF